MSKDTHNHTILCNIFNIRCVCFHVRGCWHLGIAPFFKFVFFQIFSFKYEEVWQLLCRHGVAQYQNILFTSIIFSGQGRQARLGRQAAIKRSKNNAWQTFKEEEDAIYFLIYYFYCRHFLPLCYPHHVYPIFNCSNDN